MAINQISFGGNVLPCTVERFPDIKKAQRKFQQYNIPGRNGDLFFQSDAWENVIQSYEIYAGSDQYGSQDPWTELAKDLYLDGYQTLTDTYDPDHYRKAVFNGPIDVQNSWNTHGRATIQFNCRPERYLVEGNTPKSFAATASGIAMWSMSDLSQDIQDKFAEKDITGDIYAITWPAGPQQSYLSLENAFVDGATKYYINSIAVGTETTATGVGRSSTTNISLIQVIGTNGPRTTLVPVEYFNGYPVVIMNRNSPNNRVVIGLAGTLYNNYMPSFPGIVLHNVLSHNSEIAAARINEYAIYANYDVDFPYIFIDTENFIVTKAATLTGERELASNVRVDAGIYLAKGDNLIYTTTNYEISITPNWWEL